MARRQSKQRGMSGGRVALIVIVAALMVGIAFIVKNIVSLSIEKKELQKKNEELSNKRDELTAELENVNDLDYIEEQARKLLHMIKPGEILYILDGSGNPDAGDGGNGIDLPSGPQENQTTYQSDDEDEDTEESAEEETQEEAPEEDWTEEEPEEEHSEDADTEDEDSGDEDSDG